MTVSNITYSGRADISFERDGENALTVNIDTERLFMRSVQAKEFDYENYAALYKSPEVMEKFGTGCTIHREAIETSIKDVWAKRWHDNDPYSSLATFEKSTDRFIGHVMLGHGDKKPGEAGIFYLFKKEIWGKGYGSEAVSSVVQEYAPAIVQEGYQVNGKPLEAIKASARPDNIGSIRILEKVGMQSIGEEEIYGHMRKKFILTLKKDA